MINDPQLIRDIVEGVLSDCDANEALGYWTGKMIELPCGTTIQFPARLEPGQLRLDGDLYYSDCWLSFFTPERATVPYRRSSVLRPWLPPKDDRS